MRHRKIECAGAHAAVLRTGDDTDTTPRATTLRSYPLAALAVRRCRTLLSARHVSGPVLGRLWVATAVPAVVAVVAVASLALSPHHRLGSGVPPQRAVGVSTVVGLSAKQIAVRAGAFKANVCAFFGEGVNEQPVRLDMTITAAREISTQRVILVFRRQRFALNQQIECGPEFRQIFAALFSALDIFLKLGGAAKSPHKPRSA